MWLHSVFFFLALRLKFVMKVLNGCYVVFFVAAVVVSCFTLVPSRAKRESRAFIQQNYDNSEINETAIITGYE